MNKMEKIRNNEIEKIKLGMISEKHNVIESQRCLLRLKKELEDILPYQEIEYCVVIKEFQFNRIFSISKTVLNENGNEKQKYLMENPRYTYKEDKGDTITTIREKIKLKEGDIVRIEVEDRHDRYIVKGGKLQKTKSYDVLGYLKGLVSIEEILNE